MSTESKIRLLAIAEACNPTWTSVPLVGYNFARALADHPQIELTLASHPRNREALEADSISNKARIVYPDNEYIASRAYNIAKLLRGGTGKSWTTNTAFQAVCYLFFERELHRLLRQEIDAGQFDLIHRLTPVTPTVGCPLASWTETPLLVGPMNGGLPWPSEYPELRKKENEFLVPLRKLYRQLPYYKSTYQRAVAALAGSRHTLSELPDSFQGQRIFMPENGVDPGRFELADDWTAPTDRFRFVTVGRLVPYKGLWLTLAAMKGSSKLRDAELVVVGDGPERASIESMIRDYGLQDQVTLLGQQDQFRTSRELSESQCFVFPSLREFGGGVVLEAMASGLPSIIVDYGGPADLLDPESGVLLKMQPADDLVVGLREAMESLMDDPWRCRSMALNAVERVRNEFTWQAKADQLVKIYDDLLGTNTCQPTTETTKAIELATSESMS